MGFAFPKISQSLSLRQKLFAMAICTTVLFLIGGFLSYWSLIENAKEWQKIDAEFYVKQKLLNEVQFYLGYGHGIHNFKNLVLRKDLTLYEKTLEDFNNALKGLDQFSALPSVTAEEIKALGKIKVVINQYRINTILTKRLIEEKLSTAEIDRQVKFDNIYEIEAIAALQISVRRSVAHKQAVFDKLFYGAPKLILVTWVVSLLLSGFIVQFIGNSILKPIRKLASDAEQIASGDLIHKIGTSQADTSEMAMLSHSIEKMQLSLTQNIQSLELSNKDLEQYAYVVSHDLQEPLRKILAFGSRIEASTKGKLDEETSFYLTRMLESASRMRVLIDDLLSYARISKGSTPQEEIDINKILEDVWSDLDLVAKEKGAKLKVKTLPSVSGDPIQMQQLFQNLVHNALKFSKPEVAPIVEVTAQSSEVPGFVEFFVRDNGIGFQQKYADRIMVPFQRLHSRSEYAGTGIGLALCNKIVAKHGGKLRAHSAPGEGSEFKFDLPVALNRMA